MGGGLKSIKKKEEPTSKELSISGEIRHPEEP